MSTHRLLKHLCLEAVTNVLQKPPELLVPCSVVSPAVFWVVKVPHEDQCLSM